MFTAMAYAMVLIMNINPLHFFCTWSYLFFFGPLLLEVSFIYQTCSCDEYFQVHLIFIILA